MPFRIPTPLTLFSSFGRLLRAASFEKSAEAGVDPSPRNEEMEECAEDGVRLRNDSRGECGWCLMESEDEDLR